MPSQVGYCRPDDDLGYLALGMYGTSLKTSFVEPQTKGKFRCSYSSVTQ